MWSARTGRSPTDGGEVKILWAVAAAVSVFLFAPMGTERRWFFLKQYVKAHIHSLGADLRPVAIDEMKDNNHCVAEYDGKRCTAIYNVFVGRFYVDDVYGVIDQDQVQTTGATEVAPSEKMKRAARAR